jgi:hypothetical protein
MRVLWLCLLLCASPVSAIDRIELTIGRLTTQAGLDLREVGVDWRRADGALRAGAAVRHPQLPEAVRVEASCSTLRSVDGLHCADARLRADGQTLGRIDARFGLALRHAEDWQLQLHQAEALLNYNSDDGRLAAENLQLRAEGRITNKGDDWSGQLHLQAPAGQAYAEPVFVDLSERPLTAQIVLQGDADTLQLQQFELAQDGIGRFTAQGLAQITEWSSRHRLDLQIDIADGSAATALYLQPLLAATPAQNTEFGGRLQVDATLVDRSVEAAGIVLASARLAVPGFGLLLNGIDGDAAWREALPAPASALRWQDGSIGRVPIGGAELRFAASGRDFALRAPLSLPILDGGLDIARLAVRSIGADSMAADFAAELRPIELRALCRALGWPEFSGTLSGRLPGLQLEDRRLSLDGALSASAFDGEIELSELTVIDPLGVLPRIRADLRLRRLDLAALTGAFDFGRITGRLDGDVTGLRLIGWEPVAMDARLYSTPGDRSRRRISQRAIDNISAVGGGPTGILSRGVMRFFDDFAYRRIGWRCVLDNGVCRMDGVAAHRDGQGYVIVQGSGLPRIDVVGYSRRVSWPVFLSQLKSIGSSGPAEVRGP